MSKEKQIELLEKQLAFWKHHCTGLANELKKEEEIANHYAEMLDKTEEELNDERVKNEEQGYRKQSEGEWISNRQTDEFICSLCGAIAPVDCLKEAFYESRFCPNCGARMKGGAE